MSEQHPGQQPDRPAEGMPWDPQERVGDIYEAEVVDDGRIEHAETLRPHPSIWVGSLSDYNNGILYGEWLDAAREPDEIETDIQSMLDRSPTTAHTGEPAEEWGIFDHDGFNQLRIDEHESITLVSRIAHGITEHGLAFAAYAEIIDADSDALDHFEDAYQGHYDSVEAYVEQFVEDVGIQRELDQLVPESLRPYVRVDLAALAHDMQIGGDIHVLPAYDGGVWIFVEGN